MSGLTTDIATPDRFADMNKAVEHYLKGDNPTVIARKTGFRRAYVLELLDQFRDFAVNDKGLKDRAREALYATDQHYAMIITRLWEIVEQADSEYEDHKGNTIPPNLTAKNNALKNLADIEAKRVDMLQKAGLLDDAGISAELLETEERVEQIKELLKEVVDAYPETRHMILQGLGRIWGTAEPTVVKGDVVPQGN